MRCPDLHAWMSLKLDGLLPPGQDELLEAHLQACPACTEEWRRWQAVGDLLAGAPVAMPPEDLSVRIMARIPAPVSEEPSWANAAMLGLGLTALLVVLGSPLLAGLCSLALGSPEALGAVATAANAASRAVELLLALSRGVRLFLWATMTSPSVLVAIAYSSAATAALVAWLQVAVFRPANPPQHS